MDSVAQTLAGFVGCVGVGLAAVLVVLAERTASDGVHSSGDVAWIAVVAAVVGLAGLSLLVGAVSWTGRAAQWLRVAGFVGFVLGTVGSLSWVLPLAAPVALLAIPSLGHRARSDERPA